MKISTHDIYNLFGYEKEFINRHKRRKKLAEKRIEAVHPTQFTNAFTKKKTAYSTQIKIFDEH